MSEPTCPFRKKLIRPEFLTSPHTDPDLVLRRFEREALATAALRSPHTVQLYDFGEAEDGTSRVDRGVGGTHGPCVCLSRPYRAQTLTGRLELDDRMTAEQPAVTFCVEPRVPAQRLIPTDDWRASAEGIFSRRGPLSVR
jgi:hypothetical protein